jgi:hypothetical protein
MDYENLDRPADSRFKSKRSTIVTLHTLSPDDEPKIARYMLRCGNEMKYKIVHRVGSLYENNSLSL